MNERELEYRVMHSGRLRLVRYLVKRKHAHSNLHMFAVVDHKVELLDIGGAVLHATRGMEEEQARTLFKDLLNKEGVSR